MRRQTLFFIAHGALNSAAVNVKGDRTAPVGAKATYQQTLSQRGR
tara:strand:- start:33630 stop:33764 length:135 start_codon:yes stop_codon:yes gene_type:complete